MLKRLLVPAVLLVLLPGCGSGKKPTDRLFTLTQGRQWIYEFSGRVTTAAGAQDARANQSTVTYTVAATTTKDLDNQTVFALDRVFDITLLDGTRVKRIQRLYVSQTADGIFLHGINNSPGDLLDPANDRFVPGTATPPFKFLWLPDPAANGRAISYTDPFATGLAGQGYTLNLGTNLQEVSVPAGSFLAKGIIQQEGFSGFQLSNAGITPDVGIVSGVLDATLAGTVRLQGTLLLKSVR